MTRAGPAVGRVREGIGRRVGRTREAGDPVAGGDAGPLGQPEILEVLDHVERADARARTHGEVADQDHAATDVGRGVHVPSQQPSPQVDLQASREAPPCKLPRQAASITPQVRLSLVENATLSRARARRNPSPSRDVCRHDRDGGTGNTGNEHRHRQQLRACRALRPRAPPRGASSWARNSTTGTSTHPTRHSTRPPLRSPGRCWTRARIDSGRPRPRRRLRHRPAGLRPGGVARRGRYSGSPTSASGVAAATALACDLGLADARFEQRDGTDNGLDDASFDVAWVLESSHLMRDRDGAPARVRTRVLAPGGRLVLCDIIRKRDIPFPEVRDAPGGLRHSCAPRSATRTWSRSTTTRPTLEALGLTRQRRHGHQRCRRCRPSPPGAPTSSGTTAGCTTSLGDQGVDDFVRATHILESFWQDETLGYGILAAAK